MLHQAYQDLHTIVAKKNTRSVLWVIAERTPDLMEHAIGNIKTAQELLQTKQQKHYAVGIADAVYRQLEHAERDALYACLRDQWCHTCYLYERLSEQASLTELGFQLLQTYADQTALFYFDLYDYKRVPDWLNSRFWANPEMWNKRF